MEIVEKFAAEFQIQLSAELLNAFSDKSDCMDKYFALSKPVFLICKHLKSNFTNII